MILQWAGARALHLKLLTASQPDHRFPLAPQDAAVGRKALAACKDLLPAYEKCTSTHLTSRQKELVRAPQVYLQQVAASQT